VSGILWAQVVIQIDLKDFSLPDVFDIFISQVLQATMDGLALRIENISG
jgi:hypothetical protein